MKKPRDSHLGFRMDKETHDKLFISRNMKDEQAAGRFFT